MFLPFPQVRYLNHIKQWPEAQSYHHYRTMSSEYHATEGLSCLPGEWSHTMAAGGTTEPDASSFHNKYNGLIHIHTKSLIKNTYFHYIREITLRPST